MIWHGRGGRSRRDDGRSPQPRRSSLIRQWWQRASSASGLWPATRSCARCTIRRQPGLPPRSAAAVELWRAHLAGAVAVIGNAPTALFRLLEIIAEGAAKPALVLGFPVGFVGAGEAKAALAVAGQGIPYVTLHGRRGGSALAAAAVNALASIG